MEFLTAKPDSAAHEFRAMATVARAAGSGLGQPQRALLDAVQRLVLQSDLDAETVPPITSEELASHLDDAAQARQLVRLMVATSLVDGSPSMEQVSLITSFAAALGAEEASVGVVRHLAEGRLLRFRLAFARRSHVRIYLRNSYRLLGGVLPVIKALLRFRGVIKEDPVMAARFHALEKLPEDTLGYQFFRHCRAEGLPFAGESGGFPMGALFHDFSHVLAGYDTSPEGEMKNAAFQAGFTQDDNDFFVMLFALVIHTAGINLTPFDMPVLLGRIGQPNLALETLHGWQRGAAMKVDLARDWDFWKYVELPIDAVRNQLGIPPLDVAPQ